jgi:3-deoxy-D-manno-octulosonic-acid transferase
VPGPELETFLRAYELLWFPAAGAYALCAGAARRERMIERLGFRIPTVGSEPGPTWIHALSVGEVLSALPLVDALRRAYPHTGLVFTVATSQGMQVAAGSLAGKVDRLLPMPLDFPRAMARLTDFIRPSFFILIETDIWPGLLCRLEKQGVPRLLVNGRISPRTFRTYRRFAPLARKLFERFSLCLMQTSLDRDRLLGVGLQGDRVLAAGNIKFDRRSEPMSAVERAEWRKRLGVTDGDRIWVAGSTHPGEEAALLKAFKRLQPSEPRLRLIIAPRRIESTEDILRQSLRLSLKTRLRTENSLASTAWKVLILDTLGELERVYGLADISFVGGSLVPAGGHNLLEPAAFGSPVLFGPHTFNFDQMARHLLTTGGGMRVCDEGSLYAGISAWLGDESQRRAAGAAALTFVENNRGNVQRVIAHIDAIRKGQQR